MCTQQLSATIDLPKPRARHPKQRGSLVWPASRFRQHPFWRHVFPKLPVSDEVVKVIKFEDPNGLEHLLVDKIQRPQFLFLLHSVAREFEPCTATDIFRMQPTILPRRDKDDDSQIG